jgi:hypothetical protein
MQRETFQQKVFQECNLVGQRWIEKRGKKNLGYDQTVEHHGKFPRMNSVVCHYFEMNLKNTL